MFIYFSGKSLELFTMNKLIFAAIVFSICFSATAEALGVFAPEADAR